VARTWTELQNVDQFRCYNQFVMDANESRNLLLRFMNEPSTQSNDEYEYAFTLNLEILQAVGSLFQIVNTSSSDITDVGNQRTPFQMNSRAYRQPFFSYYENCSYLPIPGYIPFTLYAGSEEKKATSLEYPRRTSSIILPGTDVIVEYVNVGNTTGTIVVSLIVEQTNVDLAKDLPPAGDYRYTQ